MINNIDFLSEYFQFVCSRVNNLIKQQELNFKNITFLPEFLPNIVIKIDGKNYLFADDKLFELCNENR